LILRKGFLTLDKNPLGGFKWKHMKNLGGCLQMDVSVKAIWAGHFCGFVGASLTSTLSKTT